ncbi:MAG: phosphatase PAP2 family protein [Actinomycetota bacterium]|nr:phosphatase PAP2 family protein [Actinomycetota bacterium]
MWSVRFALTLAAGLVAGGLGLMGLGRTTGSHDRRRLRALAPYLLAAGGVIGLYAVWQFALELLVVHTAGALRRGRAMAHVEQALHLPSEASFQRLALHAPWLVEAANRYYAWVDFPGLCAGLAWLFWRHRDRFAHYLVTLVGVTTVCSLLQAIPVAPPRLTPGFGFIDTGELFHQLVYPPGGSDPGVLTTLPSVHVAWAALVAVIVCGAGTSRWRSSPWSSVTWAAAGIGFEPTGVRCHGNQQCNDLLRGSSG